MQGSPGDPVTASTLPPIHSQSVPNNRAMATQESANSLATLEPEAQFTLAAADEPRKVTLKFNNMLAAAPGSPTVGKMVATEPGGAMVVEEELQLQS